MQTMKRKYGKEKKTTKKICGTLNAKHISSYSSQDSVIEFASSPQFLLSCRTEPLILIVEHTRTHTRTRHYILSLSIPHPLLPHKWLRLSWYLHLHSRRSMSDTTCAYTYPGTYQGDYVVCPGAAVSPVVAFAEGCVVLPGARIHVESSSEVPVHLSFGSYCLVEEGASVHIRLSTPPTSSAAPVECAPLEVRIGSFLHLQSRASLVLTLPAPARSGDDDGSFGREGHYVIPDGVVLHPFATVDITVEQGGVVASTSGNDAGSHARTLLGDHTHIMPHAHLTAHVTAAEPRLPVVGSRHVVLRVASNVALPSSSSFSGAPTCTVAVPRGGTRSVAEVSSIVDHLHGESEEDQQPHAPSTPPPPSGDNDRSSSAWVPWDVVDRTLGDRDEDMDGDVQKRCRYYLNLY